jgi:hypothetical protein
MLAAAGLAALPKVREAVRVMRFSSWVIPVVTPLPTVTVHSDPALSTAAFAVSVSVAVDVPDFVSAAVNAVEPQPLDVLRLAAVPMVNVGSTNAMLSVVGSSGAFNSSVYEIDDAVHVVASAIFNTLLVSADATVAVDVVIFTALMSATFASFSVTAAVRPLQFAGCGALLAVTPVAIVTLHT